MIPTLVIGILIFGIAAFLLTVIKKPRDSEDIIELKKNSDRGDGGFCPVCNSRLYGDEKIISHVFEGGNEKDRRCNIIGCPNCTPTVKSGVRRVCPVCKKEIDEKGYLIARMFLRKDGSQHIHIVGCSECHKKS